MDVELPQSWSKCFYSSLMLLMWVLARCVLTVTSADLQSFRPFQRYFTASFHKKQHRPEVYQMKITSACLASISTAFLILPSQSFIKVNLLNGRNLMSTTDTGPDPWFTGSVGQKRGSSKPKDSGTTSQPQGDTKPVTKPDQAPKLRA